MQCSKCLKEKEESEFSWKIVGKRRRTMCKECHTAYRRKHYVANRRKYIEKAGRILRAYRAKMWPKIGAYLSKCGCKECGNKDVRVLQFHHVRGKKFEQVTMLVRRGYSWKVIQDEIDKCDVVCANCHAIITGVNNKSWRN